MPAYRSAGSVSFDSRRNVVDPSRSLERDGIKKALAKMESVPFLEEVSDNVNTFERRVRCIRWIKEERLLSIRIIRE